MHTCCAPCSVYCIEELRNEDIEPTLYWYNPNIHPYMEYKARRDTLKQYSEMIGVEAVFEEDYGLKDFIYCYPDNLSGGMRQRVALIRTLANNPNLLLMDEPFSALDYQSRLAISDDIYNILKKEKKTMIMVTHDIAEAISMCDKVIVLPNRPATIKSIYEINLENK